MTALRIEETNITASHLGNYILVISPPRPYAILRNSNSCARPYILQSRYGVVVYTLIPVYLIGSNFNGDLLDRFSIHFS